MALVRQRVPDKELTVEKSRSARASLKTRPFSISRAKRTIRSSKILKAPEKVQLDDIQDTGVLEELIEDNKYSPFPQIQNTERPDKVSSALFNGRIAILLITRHLP
ncbi:spore germination protein [Bacillus licheniformis]|nr:spore germination protein [Bacillus licheniformis]